MSRPDVNVVVSGPIQGSQTYKTVVLKSNIGFAEQVTDPNTKYVIKWNFDLGGGTFDIDFSNADTHTVAEVTYYYIPFIADGSKYTLIDDALVFIDAEWNGLSAREIKPEKGTLFMIASITGGLHKNGYGINAVTVPENCILEFDGGSLDNGVIVGQDTVFINVGDAKIWGDNLVRLGTWREHSGGGSGEKDKPYYPEAHSGLGRKTLQLKDGSNILTQDDFNQPNIVYVIGYDFDLNNGTITIPENCVLQFEGGSIKNGDMILTETIIASEGKCFENIRLAYFDNSDGVEDFTFKSTIGNNDAHLKWYGENISMDDLQAFFDFSLGAHKDANLDGLTITIDRLISLNNLMYRHDWYWWTIKNGTIIADADNTDTIFTANEKDVLSYPRYGNYVFENIVFVNSSTIANLPPNPETYSQYNIYSQWMRDYDYTQPDNRNSDADRDYVPLAKKVCLLSGNRLNRLFINNCHFDGVSLVETGAYLESIYITGCRLNNLEYNFIYAQRAYDIHFTNNTVEFSLESVLIEIVFPEVLEVSGNLVQYVREVVNYHAGNGVTVTNNYFEGTREHVVEQLWGHGTDYGFVFTGNTCFQTQYDIVPDNGVGIYYYLRFVGAIKGFSIQGNSFYVQSFEDATTKPRPTYTVKAARFVNPKSNGVFLPSRPYELVGGGYNGSEDTKTAVRGITGDPNTSSLDIANYGTAIPVSGKAEDMGILNGGVKSYDPRIPSLGPAHRIMIDKERFSYPFTKEVETTDPNSGETVTQEVKLDLFDNLWKVIMMDKNAPYVPWIYLRRQLAEDDFAVENEELDPSIPADLAKYQSPWVKQCLMIDANFGNDYLNENLGQPESRIDFTKSGVYYNGLIRIDPSIGIQYWFNDRWNNADGFKATIKHWGPTNDRPFTVTKITSLPHRDGIINRSNNVWENDNPSRYYSALLDVSAYKDRLLQIDCQSGYMAFLKNEPVYGQTVEYATGWSTSTIFNTTSKFIVPSNAKYLYVALRAGDTLYTVNSVAVVDQFIPYNYLAGFEYFDIIINKPVWFSGNMYIGDDGWVDANGEDPYQE